MGRTTERLTVDHLAQLPGGCGECVFWELDPVRRAAVRGHEAEEKAAWVSMVLRDWGSCGRVAVVDGEVVGHLIWAPPVHVPAADGFATSPVSADAVILTTAHVYLSAMADYIGHNGHSRGSVIYSDPSGSLPVKGHGTDPGKELDLPPISFVGHGAGLNLHEEPYMGRTAVIGKQDDVILEENMVLGIEPLSYRTGYGFGMQNKDAILVTKSGCELLSDVTNTDRLFVVRASH